MTYALFLDDRRVPYEDDDQPLEICRSVEAAKECIQKNGIPETMYLDYHLGDYDPHALAFLWYLNDLAEQLGIDLSAIKKVEIISSHPKAAAMKQLWDEISENHDLGVTAVLASRW